MDSRQTHPIVSEHDKVAPHHHAQPHNGVATVTEPHHNRLALIVAIITTIFIGPFAVLLLCFWYNRYTRSPVLLGMGGVSVVQAIVTLVAGIVVRKSCLDSTNNGTTTACDAGYGFHHRTDETLKFDCATDCDTILKACGGAAAVFLFFGILWLTIGSVGMHKLHKFAGRRQAPANL
ncbi:uncharacterized protein EV422DRAFT_512066 [Fimicolochytrium jonesii]|uniref:uncharacterized protein n=1 Tax=Fimicolochytrium jonesii TaxID=1396493 RepID=UPI0022FEF49B|nr:uncharacterized protein EV422DRAFT_512066 [Fimicolochytrium jonesii]KAI8826950.1 hypothetical protein EV422DRAFT_512066 [Fimicolochytrium jonesii]